MFSSPAYNPGAGTLYAGMNDHCAWYIQNNNIPGLFGFVVKDWPAAAKLQAPRGWVTAINGATGAVLWKIPSGIASAGGYGADQERPAVRRRHPR